MKGIAMGAADVVPGVSGGTIAFITGIYDELLGSIKRVDIQALKLLFTGKFGQFMKYINGYFLLCVIGGIGVIIFSIIAMIKSLGMRGLGRVTFIIYAIMMGLALTPLYLIGSTSVIPTA